MLHDKYSKFGNESGLLIEKAIFIVTLFKNTLRTIEKKDLKSDLLKFTLTKKVEIELRNGIFISFYYRNVRAFFLVAMPEIER